MLHIKSKRPTLLTVTCKSDNMRQRVTLNELFVIEDGDNGAAIIV